MTQEQKAEILRQNGWQTLWSETNWVKKSWFGHPTIDIDRAGMDIEAAYRTFLEDQKQDTFECSVSMTYESHTPEGASRDLIMNIQHNPNWFVQVKSQRTGKVYLVDTENDNVEEQEPDKPLTYSKRNQNLRAEVIHAIQVMIFGLEELQLCDESVLDEHLEDEDKEKIWYDLPYVDKFGKYGSYDGYRIWKIHNKDGAIQFEGYTDDGEANSDTWECGFDDVPTAALCEIADLIKTVKQKANA